MQKKVLTKAKSKYLKTLGFFNHFAPTLGVIPESQNEYNDEMFHKRKTGFSQSFSKEEIRDLIVNSVKNNNIQQFRELIEQYDGFEVNSLTNAGWNVLHYACFFGYSEISLDLITKHKANVNIPNIDEWTPLHLCSFKGHQEIVKILLSNPDTEVNCNVASIGTPLHCACKKNHLQVVSLLLFKADFK
jgi:ankyrin repeat protein